jgi:hypothetical protein
MISSRPVRGLNADPSPSSSPLPARERRFIPLTDDAPALQHFNKRRGEITAEATARPAIAPYQ